MFEASEGLTPEHPAPGPELPLDASTVTGWAEALIEISRAVNDDTTRIDVIGELEKLKHAAAAAQAELCVDFDESMRAKAAATGVGKRRQGRGIAEQLALARRESPHRGRQHLGLAKILRTELPHTRAAFRAGHITEWAATLIARETACLDLSDRARVDQHVAGDLTQVAQLSEKQIGDRARTLAAKLDPASVAQRRAKAEKDRRVTIRPAPDTMTYLSGHLPVAQGVSVYAALKKTADTLIAAGDERSRAQIMADTLVTRVTGHTQADHVPVAINLVVCDQTLLGHGNDPAHLDGHGTIPADLARHLAATALDTGAATGLQTWLRTIYTSPHGGLTAMDSRARIVPHGLAHLIRLRDGGTCRTRYCDAPIRHIDHATGIAHRGHTVEENLQGVCEACNYAKQAPYWTATGHHPPHRRHQVTTTTPTGHTYTSTAPPLPGWTDPPDWQLVAANLQDPTDFLSEYELIDDAAA
ncbi:HNH endonuclease [Nocardioides jensenii]|uniref:HNH endonuclease n=1 Tax=Nocardioides jensenii TaxID=1843 RepID=UPI00082CDB80|nr:HNH endonuclease signature motif containing protein [Nocardioides jensenii]